MCNVGGQCDAGWAEPLPDGCPFGESPSDANGETLYRLIRTPSPDAEDFRSHQDLHPDRHYTSCTPCQARSLSLWTTLDQCRSLRRTKPHKSKSIATVVVAPNSGVTKSRDTGHVHWWRCAAYDPLSATAYLE